jgi:hypothetical protein
MLTGNQLRDAAKCEKKIFKVDIEAQEEMCQKCACSDGHGGCAAMLEAAQTALAYRKMLERLEWALEPGTEFPQTEWESKYFCAICRNTKYVGHKHNCELVALLKDGEAEV